MTALVRGVIAASIASGEMQNESGSMSTKTGVAPARATALAVAAKVKDGTITSSPAPMPSAIRAMCRADVPELTATHSRPPTTAANSCSKAATCGPWAKPTRGQHRVDRGPLLIADQRLGSRDHPHVSTPRVGCRSLAGTGRPCVGHTQQSLVVG